MSEESHFEDILKEVRETDENIVYLKRKRNLLLVNAILLLLNIGLITFSQEGSPRSVVEKTLVAFVILFVLSGGSFVLGFVIAMVPRGNLQYWSRYWISSLGTNLLMQLFVLVVVSITTFA